MSSIFYTMNKNSYEYKERVAITMGDSFDESLNLTEAEAMKIVDAQLIKERQKMSINIQKGVISKPQKIIIYGEAGAGKSTLGSKFPNVLFIDIEQSANQLDVARVLPRGLADIENTLRESAQLCDYDTIVVDTIDILEQVVLSEKAIILPGDYGAGYGKVKEYFLANIMPLLDNIIAKGKNLVLLAHNEVKKIELPESEGQYDRHELRLSKGFKSILEAWCDALLFLYRKSYVVQQSSSNKNKALGGKERVFESNSNTFCIAKNRWAGFPDEAKADIELILKYLPKSQAPKAEETSKITSHETPAAERKPIDKLRDLMATDNIKEVTLLKFLYGENKAKRPMIELGTNFADIPEKIITNTLLENWDKISAYINANLKG